MYNYHNCVYASFIRLKKAILNAAQMLNAQNGAAFDFSGFLSDKPLDRNPMDKCRPERYIRKL